jgi:hypothetical protein
MQLMAVLGGQLLPRHMHARVQDEHVDRPSVPVEVASECRHRRLARQIEGPVIKPAIRLASRADQHGCTPVRQLGGQLAADPAAPAGHDNEPILERLAR